MNSVAVRSHVSAAASCSPRVEATQLPTTPRTQRGLTTSLICTPIKAPFQHSQSLARGRRSGPAAPPNVWPLDQAWGTSIDIETINQTLPQNLFAFSIFPYAGFLYHLTRSKQAPPLTLFGFYFLLVFVFATIPAGIYAKKVYGTNLANVDFLHGPAEFLLTLTNLFIVLGLRQGIRQAEEENLSVGETAQGGTEASAAASEKSGN